MPHVHFVTGRLAEFALRNVLAELAPQAGFEYTIDVLGITVAALMTPEWIARRLQVPPQADRVLIPGYCHGDLSAIGQVAGVPVERGPKDLRDLPTHFGRAAIDAESYGGYDIEILAEINHAPRLSRAGLLNMARELRAAGADVIDVGCEPGQTWNGVAEAVRALRDEGLRVSIDSLNPDEIGPAVAAGAELVLSVNGSNCAAAPDWGCEVVAIPDDPATLAGLDDTVEHLALRGVPLRIDAVLEPIGFGFAHSLGRYLQLRQRYPDAEMLMGIGNLTELTDADSAAINVLLLGFCQELGIRSVLTTQVIHWAQSCVRECDLARRLTYFAVRGKRLPKHVEPRLVMLRDPRVLEHGEAGLQQLAREIRDQNVRVFAERGQLHVLAAGLHFTGDDPFELFDQLQASGVKHLDPAHGFYLGYELAKAVTALTLGKDYRQDQALDWGMLTREERSHHDRQRAAREAQRRAAEEP